MNSRSLQIASVLFALVLEWVWTRISSINRPKSFLPLRVRVPPPPPEIKPTGGGEKTGPDEERQVHAKKSYLFLIWLAIKSNSTHAGWQDICAFLQCVKYGVLVLKWVVRVGRVVDELSLLSRGFHLWANVWPRANQSSSNA